MIARVLGYQGAIDERTGVTELGPELLAMPFWTRRTSTSSCRTTSAGGSGHSSAVCGR